MYTRCLFTTLLVLECAIFYALLLCSFLLLRHLTSVLLNTTIDDLAAVFDVTASLSDAMPGTAQSIANSSISVPVTASQPAFSRSWPGNAVLRNRPWASPHPHPHPDLSSCGSGQNATGLYTNYFSFYLPSVGCASSNCHHDPPREVEWETINLNSPVLIRNYKHP